MTFLTKLMSFILLVPALFGLYSTDDKDTEEAYLAAIETVAFENTMYAGIFSF